MSFSDENVEKKLYKVRQASFPDKLTYEALILLLKHDQALRQLIHRIAEQTPDDDAIAFDDTELGVEDHQEEQPDAISSETSESIHNNDESSMEAGGIDFRLAGNNQHLPIPPDFKKSLLVELSSALRLLELVDQHSSLRTYLLAGCDSEGERLMKLLVSLGRWDQIEIIWDTLAADVKQRQLAATADELEILKGCLQCFNLANSQFKATLDQPQIPQDFNHKVHNRLNAKGKLVTGVALPGLIDSAGNTVFKVLVITE